MVSGLRWEKAGWETGLLLAHLYFLFFLVCLLFDIKYYKRKKDSLL